MSLLEFSLNYDNSKMIMNSNLIQIVSRSLNFSGVINVTVLTDTIEVKYFNEVDNWQ
jgi:hypothetical protein